MPDITAGYTYTDTSGASYTVNHSNLNALIGSASINTGVITTAKLDDGSVTNVKVDSAAAIAHSKLASLTDTYILVGNGSNVPTAVDVTGDVTITNAGVTAIGTDKVLTANILDDNVTADKLADTAVTPAEYTLATVTIDQQGRITAASSGASRGVLQVVYVQTDAQPTAYEDNDMVQIAGLQASITPSSESSTILIQVSVTFGCDAYNYPLFGLQRDDAQIGSSSLATGNHRAGMAGGGHADWGYPNYALTTVQYQHMDAPASVAEVTYDATTSQRQNTYDSKMYLNRPGYDIADDASDADSYCHGISSITLSEISA